MLNSFYNCILVVSRITQIDIHLKFRIFNHRFDHLKKLKNIMITNTVFLQRAIVIKAYQAVSNKLSNYWSKTEDSNKTIYNLVNILDLTQKLNFYKIRNENNDQDEKNTISYKIKYKKKFKKFFQHHYDSTDYRKEITHNADQTEKVIQFNNAIACSLLMYAQSVFIIRRYILQQFQRSSSTVIEIDRYFHIDMMMKNNSIWNYWRDNISNFSQLTLIIKDVFLYFISFVNIERVFSLVQRICRWKKS